MIVFFLISGFCIHYPYKNSWSKETIIPFIIARLTRITLPIIIVAVIIEILGINASIFYLLVGWSIVCEIVYYIIYPFLRLLIKNKKGWQKLLLLSYIPTILAFWFFPLKLVNYPGVGFYYVISLGFPCWMLGLLLCYSIDNNNQHLLRRFPSPLVRVKIVPSSNMTRSNVEYPTMVDSAVFPF